MLTIADSIEQIVRETPFIEEGMRKGLINLSALARDIRPKIEEDTYKKVTEGAIIMALKRLSDRLQRKMSVKKQAQRYLDMIVRSNLVEYTFSNSDSLLKKHEQFLIDIAKERKNILMISQGVFETTMIVSKDLQTKVQETFRGEKITKMIKDLSCITIKLPEESLHTPGVFYTIFKLLAWYGINITEVVSTYTEFTIILQDKEIDRAFSILNRFVH